MHCYLFFNWLSLYDCIPAYNFHKMLSLYITSNLSSYILEAEATAISYEDKTIKLNIF